jgi:hypothetical protein
VGDRVKDAQAGREAIITDIVSGEYVLRPRTGPVDFWTVPTDEHLTIVVPREEQRD